MKTLFATAFLATLPGATIAAPVITGMYVYGPEVSSFQACNSDKVMWLKGEGEGMILLQENAQAVSIGSDTPYSPIWVAISANEAPAEDELSPKYSGVLELTALHNLAWKVEPAACPQPATANPDSATKPATQTQPKAGAESPEPAKNTQNDATPAEDDKTTPANAN